MMRLLRGIGRVELEVERRDVKLHPEHAAMREVKQESWSAGKLEHLQVIPVLVRQIRLILAIHPQ